MSKFRILMNRLYVSPAYRNGDGVKRYCLWVKVMNFTDFHLIR
jgi:hypothetical protein